MQDDNGHIYLTINNTLFRTFKLVLTLLISGISMFKCLQIKILIYNYK